MTGEQGGVSEEAAWKTHCRQLQVSAIQKEILAAYHRIFSKHQSGVTSLNRLGLTPPALISKGYQGS